MSERWILGAGLVLALALVGCASDGSDTTAAKPQVSMSDTKTVTATVVAIDQKTRNVTLRGPEGRTVMINAPAEVRNLAQVKPGDQVVATYYEAAAIRVLAPGEATPGVGAASASDRAKLGEMPSAATVDAVTITSTVEKIDKGAQQVTLRLPDGTSDVVNVRDPKNLENVKVGDLVEVAYMRAVSIEVKTPTQ